MTKIREPLTVEHILSQVINKLDEKEIKNITNKSISHFRKCSDPDDKDHTLYPKFPPDSRGGRPALQAISHRKGERPRSLQWNRDRHSILDLREIDSFYKRRGIGHCHRQPETRFADWVLNRGCLKQREIFLEEFLVCRRFGIVSPLPLLLGLLSRFSPSNSIGLFQRRRQCIDLISSGISLCCPRENEF